MIRGSSLAIAVLLAVSGCAYGNRTVRLAYPPRGGPQAPLAVPESAPVVALKPVTDRRPEPRHVIAWIENGFGTHTADVVTPDDVAAWVTGAVRRELEVAGLRVVGETPGSTIPLLDAELWRVECRASWGYTGRVGMHASIRAGDGYALNESYTGIGSGGTNWGATAEGYGQCVTRALQEAARKIAADVLRTLRAPAAAAPPAS